MSDSAIVRNVWSVASIASRNIANAGGDRSAELVDVEADPGKRLGPRNRAWQRTCEPVPVPVRYLDRRHLIEEVVWERTAQPFGAVGDVIGTTHVSVNDTEHHPEQCP